MTNPLNIIFDEFGKWFLGYRIEFSYLLFHNIRTLWLWSTDEHVFVFILSESPSITCCCHIFVSTIKGLGKTSNKCQFCSTRGENKRFL